MEKLLFLCRRRRELEHDEYAARLLEGHVPLALRHHPLMRRYVVHLVERGSGDHPEIDSINELHYDTLADFRERSTDSEEGARIIREDLRRFLGVVYGYATREVVHRDTGPERRPGERTPGMKWICAVRRHLDLDVDTFRRRWLDEHVPLMLAHQPGVTRIVSDVVQSKLTGPGDDWDLFYELSFPPSSLAAGFYDSPQGEAALRASSEALCCRRATFAVAEHPQKLEA